MHSKPTHYAAWLGLAYDLAQCLEKAGSDYRILTSMPLARHGIETLGVPAEKLCALTQRDVKAESRESNLSWIGRSHRDALNEQELGRLAATMKGRLDGFEPDRVLSYTAAPFLRKAFPKAEMLHMDAGIFSRDPFPRSLFFDPLGLFDSSVPAVASEELLNFKPSEEQWQVLHRLRREVGLVFERLSPLTPHLEQLRSQSRALWLMPLQFEGEIAFETTGEFRNNAELIYHVMEGVPPDIGVIATEHPTSFWTGDYLDAESLRALRADFPNLLLVDDWRRMTGVTQTLVPQADAVLTVCSSIGLQGLLWQTPVISLGKSHIQPFAAARSVEEAVARVDELRAPEGVDAAICWLLNHYWVPDRYYLDADWQKRFVETIAQRRAEAENPLAWYQPIGEPHAIVETWLRGIQDYELGQIQYLPSNL